MKVAVDFTVFIVGGGGFSVPAERLSASAKWHYQIQGASSLLCLLEHKVIIL